MAAFAGWGGAPASALSLLPRYVAICLFSLCGGMVPATLFMLAVPEFTFLLHPLMARYSRRREFEADAYATQHADSSELVHALVKLYNDNAATLTPDPLHSAFYDSHPPAAIRIARLTL